MTQVYRYSPVNIQSGNTVHLVVEYFDDAGIYTQPATGTASIAYTNTSNVAVTDTVPLSLTNQFFTGTWSTAVAALGLATWTVLAGSTVCATGQIRVIQRQGG